MLERGLSARDIPKIERNLDGLNEICPELKSIFSETRPIDYDNIVVGSILKELREETLPNFVEAYQDLERGARGFILNGGRSCLDRIYEKLGNLKQYEEHIIKLECGLKLQIGSEAF